MSSRTAFALVTLLLAARSVAGAQDWERIAASSSQAQDRAMIQLMKGGDLDMQLAVCRGLGTRRDSDVRTIIGSLTASYSPETWARTELLLRWLLASARSSHPVEDDFRAWIASNQPATDVLLAGTDRWRAPMLKVELIAVALVAGGPVSQRAVAEAGAGLVERLEETAGFLSGEETSLALAFLDAARRTSGADLLSPCADIARLSRDQTVVDAARQASAKLAQ